MFTRKPPPEQNGIAMKDNQAAQQAREGVISIIGPGMRVVGDCTTEGTLRIEGTVEGTVKAGKAVVVGKDGVVLGDVNTQDAVIGGRIVGTIIADSRLELQATCTIEGEVRARRIKLEEGGRVNGNLQTGDSANTRKELPAAKRAPEGQASPEKPEKPVAANG